MNHPCIKTIPGTLICVDCYKPKNDPCHNVEILIPSGVTTKSTQEIPVETSNLVPDLAIFNHDQDISKFSIMQAATDEDPEPVPEGYLIDELPKVDMSPRGAKTIHVVPPDDIPQIAAEGNRARHILGERGHYLTGAESVAIAMEHEAFVVANLINDKNGNEYPDWMERVEIHIADLRKKIESFRIKESAVFKVRAAKECEDLTKLSPEEIEQYKRDIGKRKKKVAAEAAAETTKDVEKQIKALQKKRDAAADALKAADMDADTIAAMLKSKDDEIAALQKKLQPTPAAKAESGPRMSKREKAIESLVKAGIPRDKAEGMVPNA